MSWIDISVGSGSSGSGSSNNLLSDFINSLGNALSNASASGGIRGFPWQVSNQNDQIVGYYDDSRGYYSVIKKFLAERNYHSNERLKNALERIINIQNRINHLNHEIADRQNAINRLNNEIYHLNNEIHNQTQAIKQEEEKLNALELQTNEKQNEKEIKESLKRLEKLKQELKRFKKQWKKQFNFLTDNPPNLEAQQQHALNQTRQENARMNFFLTNPYAILPKGFIYEYHNPGKETYNALNAFNPMDGINNQFRTNMLNQVLDNSYQKFLPGNDSYNALGSIEQVKALKFYDLVINHTPQSDKLESALFFKQISQYAKGLRLKILTAPSSKKDLAGLEKLEHAIKLQESIKAKQNLESQRNKKEREKQNQEHDKRNKEQERNNLNNEINAIGNERLTFKQLGVSWNLLGIQPYLNNNGRGRTYARAFFSDKNKSIREYYEIETKIKSILGFYRIGESDERLLSRFLELPSYQQNEVAQLLLN
ncbi:hypothetical protein HpVH12_15030 [Helicobacter pylori]